MRKYAIILFMTVSLSATAQIGQHRNDLSIGVNGGYAMSNVGFTPKVTQGMHGGITAGLSLRYVCEKYFSTICSIYTEINYAQIGWKERIVDITNAPVINAETGLAEKYSRTLNYIQIPVFAHLAWGKEHKGIQFFFQAGSQFGYLLSESTKANFDVAKPNLTDRSNKEISQYSMPVEHKIDYGIVAGIGMEYTIPKVGHILLDGRYYYGLGNIYGDSKRDYFAKSNLSNIVVKLTYLFDITKTK